MSASATTTRLVRGQAAVPDEASETTDIPILLERLSENDGLKGAIVFIDATATNGTIASAIRKAGADHLLANKANRPTLLADVAREVAPSNRSAVPKQEPSHSPKASGPDERSQPGAPPISAPSW